MSRHDFKNSAAAYLIVFQHVAQEKKVHSDDAFLLADNKGDSFAFVDRPALQ